MVEPAITRLFATRGIILEDVAARRISRRPGAEMEVDLLAIDNDFAVVVEVKTRLKQSDVDEHLERLTRFKDAFPEYSTKQVLGAVAGMEVPANVAKYAYRMGLFVLAQSGETMDLLNDSAFQPATW